LLFLITGLGNPGREYAGSRHNVGFLVLDRLAAQAGLRFTADAELAGLTCQGDLATRSVLLLAPQTFMNLSGRAVAAACQRHALGADQLLVIHDDMDLELGRIQLRQGGGDGGHKGIRSIGAELGRLDFHRMRLGVGRPAGDGGAVEHVLGGFTQTERPALEELLSRAAAATETWLREGSVVAMNRFNPWRARGTAPETPSRDSDA
jgi:peptidyl-tRNA hydrolase, PTH1 family